MRSGPKASVLIVDDDARVRRILRRRLELGGYVVAEAADGDSALAAYRSTPADVVITDLVMPNKSGQELIRDLQREFPGVRVIAISGALDRDIAGILADASDRGALRALAKPFTTDQLLEVVEAALRGGSPSATHAPRSGPRRGRGK